MRVNRVAIVSEHASPLAKLGNSDAGGQNVYVAALADELARREIDVVVYTRRADAHAPARVELAEGVVVEHIQAGPPIPVARDALLPFMDEFGQRLGDALTSWRPDVVHAHYWMSGLASRPVATGLEIPLVLTFHALGSTKRRHQGAMDTSPRQRRACEVMLASSVSAVVATSNEEVRELFANGARPRIAEVIPCGVDTALFAPRATPAAPRRRIVSVGRLIERKGVDDLVRALQLLPDLQLIIGGGTADPADGDAARLSALARQLDVADRVMMTGPVDHQDVPALLRSGDVVACVPWYEPFGMVALEAMACGVPVVASAVGGLRDLVVDGETGLHAPARDPMRIAQAIRTLTHDSALRFRCATQGRQRALEYAWSSVVDSLLQLYERVIAEGA